MSFAITNDPSNTPQTRHVAAVKFIDAHAAQHLDDEQLVARTATHIMVLFNVPQRMAMDVALHAIAEVQQRHRPAWVDINHSTSYVVMVVCPHSGRTVAFTASELMDLAIKKQGAIDTGENRHRCGTRADLAA